MTSYVAPPVPYDPTVIAQRILERMVADIPGWTPREGNLEVLVVEGVAAEISAAMTSASTVATSIFRFFGQSVMGLVPLVAAPARMLSTWTMKDGTGYTIPSGTTVGYKVTGTDSRQFATEAAVTVVAGQTVATAVPLVAVAAGARSNALPPATLALTVPLAFVASVASTAATAGGVDAETDVDYLDRLTSELRLLTPRPILPTDFAILAQRTPGVARALAVDGFNPTDGTSGNPRMVTVVVVNDAGGTVPAPVRLAVDASLQAQREVNFQVTVIDPAYLTVNIAYTLKAAPLVDATAVQAAADVAVKAFLDPATWGVDVTGTGWQPQPIVRFLHLAAALDSVPGVDYVQTLTLNGQSTDLALPVGGLPQVGTLAGTVV